MNRSFKQRKNKDIVALNDTLDQMGLIGPFTPKKQNTHSFIHITKHTRTFSKIDHMIGPKTSLKKFKKI